jgi:hypothetical protein
MLRPLGLALAVSAPAALLAQVLDALADGDGAGVIVYPLALLVLAGAAVGGVVARQARLGAVVGLVDVVVVALFGIARRMAADDGVPWGSALALAVLGAAIGATAGALARARTARTRA